MVPLQPLRLAPALVFASLLLSGCSGSGSGNLSLHATDAPDNIGDFSSLMIEVDEILVKHKGSDGGEKEASYEAASSSFDLTKLTSGNVTTLFSKPVEAGNYTRIELVIAKATGTLKADNRTVEVKAPKGSLFVNQHFTVGDGSDVHFLFDIHVVAKGNGEYSLQPNGGGSGVVAKPVNGKVAK